MKSDETQTNTSKPTSLPWHIYFDKKDDKNGERVGRLIHIEEPQYECRFYIGDKNKQGNGLTIHNEATGVQLFDLKLPEGHKPNFKEISTSMKHGAEFLHYILYPPYFRKSHN